MSFAVTAEAYDAFMGRFSRPLATAFADLVDPAPGSHVLDVGSGPGALTAELLARGATVSAIDPAQAFADALAERHPEVEVRVGAAESLPYPDHAFDAAAAQLVVHFLRDPTVGVREMARVTRPGGLVAACVWDFEGDRAPLHAYWKAAVDVDPATTTEAALTGSREGDLSRVLTAAGLTDVVPGEVEVAVEFATFDDYWQPFTYGVGPAGVHCTGLTPDHREAVRARCRELLGPGPFVVRGVAWAATGRAGVPRD